MPQPHRVVAIDVETTGFSKQDRIVEFAGVEFDIDSGEVTDEIETLVNPQRDVGPTHVHGITASMVSAAPTFEEVVGAISRRLQGAVLVAHNISFDVRFLRQEFERLGIAFAPGAGYCTLRATSQKLGLACRSHGIAHDDQHRGLSDARITAQLAARLDNEAMAPKQGEPESCRIGYIEQVPHPRTLRRSGEAAAPNDMVRVVSRAHYPFSDEALLSYLDLLDWVLDDHVITVAEGAALRDAAHDLGINQRQVEQAHRAYFDSIVASAMRDHVVTPGEHDLLVRIARTLDLDDAVIPDTTSQPSHSPPDSLPEGTRVCFTGTAVIDGQPVARDVLEQAAAIAGLVPVATVTKKGCDLLVTADPHSTSGKAEKARRLGVPMMKVGEFLEQVG